VAGVRGVVGVRVVLRLVDKQELKLKQELVPILVLQVEELIVQVLLLNLNLVVQQLVHLLL
jgi:hypothetical protein